MSLILLISAVYVARKFIVSFGFMFIVRCFSHTESEMKAFLDHLVNCLQHEGTTAVVNELTRY